MCAAIFPRKTTTIVCLGFCFDTSSMQLTNGLKHFGFWFRIRWVIRILSLKIWLPNPGYDTPASQSPQGRVSYPRRVTFFYTTRKVRITQRNPNQNKKNSLTHWPVGQGFSNDEKNYRSKISFDYPFKYIYICNVLSF